MDDGKTRPWTIDQHNRANELLQCEWQARPNRTPDDAIHSVLHQECESVGLALETPLAVDEADRQAKAARSG